MVHGDKVLTLRYVFKFLHHLPKSVMLEVIASIANISGKNDTVYPPLVWQSGLVVINGPLTVALSYQESKGTDWWLHNNISHQNSVVAFWIIIQNIIKRG